MANVDSKQLDQIMKWLAEAGKLDPKRAQRRGHLRDKAVHEMQTFGKAYQVAIKDLKSQLLTDAHSLETAQKTAREMGAPLDGPLLEDLKGALALLEQAWRDINPLRQLEAAMKSANDWDPESPKHDELKAAIYHLLVFKNHITSKNGQTPLKDYDKELNDVSKDVSAEKDNNLKAKLESNLSKVEKLSGSLDW